MCRISLPKNYSADDRDTLIYSCIDKKKIPDLRTLRDLKKCIKCKKVVSKKDFYRKDKNVCKECEIKYQSAYRKKYKRRKIYLYTYEKTGLQVGRSKEYFKQMKKKSPEMFKLVLQMGDGDLAVGYDKVIKYHQTLMQNIVDLSSENKQLINKQDLFFIKKKVKENFYKLPFYTFLKKVEKLEKELRKAKKK